MLHWVNAKHTGSLPISYHGQSMCRPKRRKCFRGPASPSGTEPMRRRLYVNFHEFNTWYDYDINDYFYRLNWCSAGIPSKRYSLNGRHWPKHVKLREAHFFSFERWISTPLSSTWIYSPRSSHCRARDDRGMGGVFEILKFADLALHFHWGSKSSYDTIPNGFADCIKCSAYQTNKLRKEVSPHEEPASPGHQQWTMLQNNALDVEKIHLFDRTTNLRRLACFAENPALGKTHTFLFHVTITSHRRRNSCPFIWPHVEPCACASGKKRI